MLSVNTDHMDRFLRGYDHETEYTAEERSSICSTLRFRH